MSTTATTTSNDPLSGVSQPKVQEKPKLACTGIIEKVGEAADTSSGNYSGVDVYLKATNGSRKLFPKMYFRPEMFSFGLFDADRDYLRNEKNIKDFAVINEKSGKTMGETFETVYGMNVMPRVRRDKDGNVTGTDGQTPFSSIAGGTLDGLRALIGAFKTALAALPDTQVNLLGYKEFTPEQIVAILNEYIQTSGGVEQALIARQSKNQAGDLTDNYEVDRWQGAFSTEIDAANEKARAKSAGQQIVGRRLVIGYNI